MSNLEDWQNARDKLEQAGHIASHALTFTCQLVKPGASLLKIAESGEQRIRELGGQPAFPINLSLNFHAAHFTPHPNDSRTVPDHALVKVDLGAHVDGFIADTARTVAIGADERMKQLDEAARAGLAAAIATARAGIRVWEVSRAISKAMRQPGVRPIENLTGHSIEQFCLHAGVSVPAVTNPSDELVSPRLRDHMVVAIEPFATFSTVPRVVDLEPGAIFGFSRKKNPQSAKLRSIFSQMKVRYAQLPFASRWLAQLVSPAEIDPLLGALRREGCIQDYPVLGLRDGNMISQAEHTLIIEQDGCTVTTLASEREK
jgi:methionyl aminopeptidase